MDSVFSLVSESDRRAYLRSLVHSFGCSYICLWFYLPHPNGRLFFLDGYYHEHNSQQPGTSAGSLARRLFDEYRQQMFFAVNDRVPGMAFLNNQPYQELNDFHLQRLASTGVQRQFYQEARIKTAVFMGCSRGEIEMGWSNGTQVNMENSIRGWFSDQQQSPLREIFQAVDINKLSSTSSPSLRSLSTDSPESSSLLFNLPSSTIHLPDSVSLELPSLQTPTVLQSFQWHQQATDAFALRRNIHLPSQESEEAAMTRAFLAVLTSSSTPNLPHLPQLNQKASAFKKYLAPTPAPRRPRLRRRTMLKRCITFYASLNLVGREQMQSNRPTSTQLHHVISERKRREKINESFEALRKLIPPEAKKDKASVLSRTREYLVSLKAQFIELSERNKQLEAQLLPNELEASEGSSERVAVRITHDTESTSEEQRIINLLVVLRGESSVADIVIRILEFLNQVHNVSFISMAANSGLEESRSLVTLRLKVEGNEWDETAFQEAIRRVVGDQL